MELPKVLEDYLSKNVPTFTFFKDSKFDNALTTKGALKTIQEKVQALEECLQLKVDKWASPSIALTAGWDRIAMDEVFIAYSNNEATFLIPKKYQDRLYQLHTGEYGSVSLCRLV